jgi:hypothetical protein
VRRDPSHAKSTHPLSGSRDRTCNAPAHDQQGDEHYEEDLNQHSDECLAPGAQVLRMNIVNVVNNGQTTDNLILTVQRQGKNMYPIVPESGE